MSEVIVSFTVLGEPAPQGSKTRTKFGGIREANPRTRPWRQAVAAEALEAMQGREPVLGPVALIARLYFDRPKAHYGSGRNAEVLKESAPSHKTTAPDGSKLRRNLEDAMAGIVYRDDAQVADGHEVKLYGSPARVEIEVRTLEAAADDLATERSPA